MVPPELDELLKTESQGEEVEMRKKELVKAAIKEYQRERRLS